MAASKELECCENFASVLCCVRSFDFLTLLCFSIKCHFPSLLVEAFVSSEQVLVRWHFYYDFIMVSQVSHSCKIAVQSTYSVTCRLTARNFSAHHNDLKFSQCVCKRPL